MEGTAPMPRGNLPLRTGKSASQAVFPTGRRGEPAEAVNSALFGALWRQRLAAVAPPRSVGLVDGSSGPTDQSFSATSSRRLGKGPPGSLQDRRPLPAVTSRLRSHRTDPEGTDGTG